MGDHSTRYHSTKDHSTCNFILVDPHQPNIIYENIFDVTMGSNGPAYIKFGDVDILEIIIKKHFDVGKTVGHTGVTVCRQLKQAIMSISSERKSGYNDDIVDFLRQLLKICSKYPKRYVVCSRLDVYSGKEYQDDGFFWIDGEVIEENEKYRAKPHQSMVVGFTFMGNPEASDIMKTSVVPPIPPVIPTTAPASTIPAVPTVPTVPVISPSPPPRFHGNMDLEDLSKSTIKSTSSAGHGKDIFAPNPVRPMTRPTDHSVDHPTNHSTDHPGFPINQNGVPDMTPGFNPYYDEDEKEKDTGSNLSEEDIHKFKEMIESDVEIMVEKSNSNSNSGTNPLVDTEKSKYKMLYTYKGEDMMIDTFEKAAILYARLVIDESEDADSILDVVKFFNK